MIRFDEVFKSKMQRVSVRRGVPSSGNTNDEAKTLVSNLQILVYERGIVSGDEIIEQVVSGVLKF